VRPGARVGRLAAGLLTAAIVVFALPARLPGGTETGLLGTRAGDPTARLELRRDLHLERALPGRFAGFVADALHGDLGFSPVSGVDVGAVVGERLAESAALAATAVGLAFLIGAGARGGSRRRTRARDAAPVPSAVHGALWVLPLLGAIVVAMRFGGIPAPDPHAAIVTRVAASLLPAALLGSGLAAWTAVGRRTRRDLLAAVLVGTLVTEALSSLPGLGALLADSAARGDPLMVRGALLALSAVAIAVGVALLPITTTATDVRGGPSSRRRAAGGTAATLWVVALVVATIGRLHLGLAPASRLGAHVGAGVSTHHPFGTDVLGRDVLARVLATGRGSLLLVVAATVIAMLTGTAIGAVVGFAGGRVERLALVALAGWAAFPGELVAVALLAFNGRDGRGAAIALAMVAVPAIASGAQRRTLDALQRSRGESHLKSGLWLRNVGSRAVEGAGRATLATMFVGASRVLVAELVAGFLGFGPAATQTWSREITMQFAFVSRAPLAVIAPVAVALGTATALAGLGNAIRPARSGWTVDGSPRRA
jgi:peptide/nickel transport system permease protein